MDVPISKGMLENAKVGFFVAKRHVGVKLDTPWKINMEPTNQPFRRENDLPNLHHYGPC